MQQTKLYKGAINLTLRFYESWILPSSIVRQDFGKGLESLHTIKLKEFRERKALLNPYTQQKMLEEGSTTEEENTRLQKLVKINKAIDMKTFKMTYNRHERRYGYQMSNFPKEYPVGTPTLDFAKDPDWSTKQGYKRFNFKAMFLGTVFLIYMIQRRAKAVDDFDRLKRHEQKAMQNTEVDEVFGKKVSFTLFVKKEGEDELVPMTERTCKQAGVHTVFWFDAKMKNYELFCEYLANKKMTHYKINPVLVVEQEEQLVNVLKNWEERDGQLNLKGRGGTILGASSGEKSGKESFSKVQSMFKVALKRPLSDKEQLLQSFDETRVESELELDIKKKFFYVVNPNGEIIDCAQIYTFLHEDNIFKRITAKISKDVDQHQAQEN